MMRHLLVVGALDRTSVFGARDVVPEMSEDLCLAEGYQDRWYKELVPLLTALGCLDLVRVIERKRAELQRRLAWQEERDWTGSVKRFDRKSLGQGPLKAYYTIRSLARLRATSLG